MNEIYTRRSIRKFKDIPLEDEKIKQILKAGMNAPSAGNQQPWEFVVIKNKETLQNLSQFAPYWFMLNDCAAAVVVCGNKDKEKFAGYWIQDCSASLQNILLEATSLNIGSVWLGTTPITERVEAVKKAINAPQNVEPLGIVALGYADEQKEPNDKFNEDMIIKEKY